MRKCRLWAVCPTPGAGDATRARRRAAPGAGQAAAASGRLAGRRQVRGERGRDRGEAPPGAAGPSRLELVPAPGDLGRRRASGDRSPHRADGASRASCGASCRSQAICGSPLPAGSATRRARRTRIRGCAVPGPVRAPQRLRGAPRRAGGTCARWRPPGSAEERIPGPIGRGSARAVRCWITYLLPTSSTAGTNAIGSYGAVPACCVSVPQPLPPTAVLYSWNEVPTVEQVISPPAPPRSFEADPATNRLPGSLSDPTVTPPDADSVEIEDVQRTSGSRRCVVRNTVDNGGRQHMGAAREREVGERGSVREAVVTAPRRRVKPLRPVVRVSSEDRRRGGSALHRVSGRTVRDIEALRLRGEDAADRSSRGSGAIDRKRDRH